MKKLLMPIITVSIITGAVIGHSFIESTPLVKAQPHPVVSAPTPIVDKPIEVPKEPVVETIVVPEPEQATVPTYDELMAQYDITSNAHLAIVFNDILFQYPEKFSDDRRESTFIFLYNYFDGKESADYIGLYTRLHNRTDW
jgi:hypothetical protein